MQILLGVSGGIAAYKSAELVRLYQRRGWRVQVVMTATAQRFVQPLTFAALTGQPVLTDLFAPEGAPAPAIAGGFGADPAQPHEDAGAIEHIRVAQSADVLVVAPATAHTLARLAAGLADDYLATLYLASPAPVVLAPAMNIEMWRHPATQANLERLGDRGASIVAPGEGYLACGMVGAGRMAELEAIVAATEAAALGAHRSRDLAGEVVLVTAGPTREAIDPVRYLTNRSSGRMGYALAAAAAGRGARVILISGPCALPAPENVELVKVTTAEEMALAAEAAFSDATMGLLAAAVADYRPQTPSATKIKKSAAKMELALERTPDILATLGAHKGSRLLVGFAAETESDGARARELGRAKLRAKNADLIVLNDVSRDDIGFDVEANAVTLITAAECRDLPRASKRHIAEQVLDAALRVRQGAPLPALP